MGCGRSSIGRESGLRGFEAGEDVLDRGAKDASVVEPAKASIAATSKVTETGKADPEPRGKKNEALRKNEMEGEKKSRVDSRREAIATLDEDQSGLPASTAAGGQLW